MAAIKNLSFSGRIENLVFYQQYGKTCVRMVPKNTRQSKGTKMRSTNFGIAARAGKALRSELLQQLPFPLDKAMQSKFSGAIAKWLGLQSVNQLHPLEDMEYIINFDFNPVTSFIELFRVPFTVISLQGNQFQVSIPAFVPTLSILAPAETLSVTGKSSNENKYP